MGTKSTRRSDRVSLELPLQLSGIDHSGVGYIAEAHTLIVSRHGGKIIVDRKLVPKQELTVRCIPTGRTADARMVGQTGREPLGYFYGIEFLDGHANPWNIEFPPLADSRKAVARTLLECVRCHKRVVSYLSEVEAEVFEANRCLSRHCKSCHGMGLWTEPVISAATEPAPAHFSLEPVGGAPQAELLRSQNEREETRTNLRMTACLRTAEFGEEIVFTEDVSPGGFRFKSPKLYAKGPILEIAVPYSKKSGSVFVLAQIEWSRPLPSEGMMLYGAWYVQMHGRIIQRIEEETGP
jgi:PilZ domain-containing protein